MKKRLLLLVLATLFGAILFVPFVRAASDNTPVWLWLIFPAASVLAVLVFGGLGLQFADRADFPMPLLRPWEMGQPVAWQAVRQLRLPALAGVALALLITGLNRYFHPPANPGSLAVRIITTPWAALVTEIISHLFTLSGLYLLWRNEWAALLGSSLVFLGLFHLNGADSNSSLAIYLGLMNFVGILLSGWFYCRRGFEAAVVTHAAMHLVLLTLG